MDPTSWDLFEQLAGGGPKTIAPVSQVRTTQVAANDDDDWGDFEGAEVKPATNIVKGVPESAPKRYQYSLDDLTSPTAPVPPKPSKPPKKVDLLDFDSFDGSAQKKTMKTAFPKDPNVLFDANDDDDDDDDDFGDFEDPLDVPVPQPSKPPKPPAQEMDLLGLMEMSTSVSSAKTPAPVSHTMQHQFDLLGLDDSISFAPASKQSSSSRVIIEAAQPKAPVFGRTKAPKPMKRPAVIKTEPEPEAEEEEPWDDFTAWEKEETTKSQASPARQSILSPKEVPLEKFGGSEDPGGEKPDDLQPTNVPPPAMVLTLFIPIFQRVEEELLKPAAAHSQIVRHEIYNNQATIEYLKGYLKVLTVCARVIAGRKLRWKRDTILAQSMRIGSASAGRVSGMKVTSIDKSELKKEDGEVAEVLRVWGAQVGRLRSVVAEIKKNGSTEVTAVPEIKDTMPIKTLKQQDGGISCLRPCALCGLKREERISKVDVDVLDAFGEWWVDRTNMHRGWSY